MARRARLRVREIAEEKGISMSALSRQANVNIGTVRRVFRDPLHDVSLSVLEQLAEGLGVRVTELIDDTPPSEEGPP